MRDEREAMWDGWEISEMGEKFRQWSFKGERADGETEKEEREENRKNERHEREILSEIGVKYNFIFAILWIVQFYV